jgi:hypothetical protein
MRSKSAQASTAKKASGTSFHNRSPCMRHENLLDDVNLIDSIEYDDELQECAATQPNAGNDVAYRPGANRRAQPCSRNRVTRSRHRTYALFIMANH